MNEYSRISFIMLCLLYSVNSIGQIIIQGSVYDSNKSKLQQASVVLKDSISNKVFDYTYTDKNGNYKLNSKSIGSFQIEFRHLGYASKTVTISLENNQNANIVDIMLDEKPMNLDEVIVQAERPIIIRNDTISYKTEHFINGTEQTVEDLLRVIPGLQIDREGTIKVGNQEIEKLMVDGDDLFEKGYKILSKNMPAYPVEEVELLKNYSNNRFLKGVEKSQKVALNLQLNENFRRIWFGNIKTSLSYDKFYELKGNLMNFGKKNKYYFLTNLNNTGYDATGDVEDILHPFRINEPASIGDNQHVDNLLSLSISNLSFKNDRVNFNSAKLVSFNTIFNPTEKLKIKALGFFNQDENDFYKKNIDIINVNYINFTNIEDYVLNNKKRIAFGKLDFIYAISKSQMIETSTKINNGNFNDSSNLIFNDNSTIENLQCQNILIDQKVSYTQKIADRKVLLLTGRFIKEKVPQNYLLNQFFYQELFPKVENANKIKHYTRNQMQFAGINAHLLNKKENGNLFELQFGNEFRYDMLKSEFSILDNQRIVYQPLDYQNNTIYQVNNTYIKSRYLLSINNFEIVGKLDFHQLFNSLENNEVFTKQNPFFINPAIGFDWKINDKSIIKTSYSYNTTNTNILDVYSDFVLTSYRSFSKGTGSFDQLKSSNLILNYQLGNWTSRFFINTFLLYGKNHDFYSTNTILNRNFFQVEKMLIKNREFLSLNSKLDYFFRLISSNIKFNLGYMRSQFKNIVNSSDLREVVSNTYNYGLEIRSGFKSIFNYHLGTNWSTTEIETAISNAFTDNVIFLDLAFVFNKFDFQLQSERYFFGELQNNDSYYFFDVDLRYKFIENKLILGLSGKNLFDTQRFRTFSVSDIGSSSTEYRLLPRCMLLKIEYRF